MKLSLRLTRVARSSSGYDSARKSLLTSSRTTANRIFLSAIRILFNTSRYTCLLLLACATFLGSLPGSHCWNPYEALEYRTFNDPPMDPSFALAMTQAMSAPMVPLLSGYMSDQPAAPGVSAPLIPAVTLADPAPNQLSTQVSSLSAPAPTPEVKSVMSQLASTALEVAQEVASNVVQNVVQSASPVTESPFIAAATKPEPVVQETAAAPPKTSITPPQNNSEPRPANPLSPAGKILGELVHSKNTSDRLVNVAFQLLKPRKQDTSAYKSHTYAEQQIISQHSDMFHRHLLRPVKHRDTSGLLGTGSKQSDGARNSPLGSALSNFKAAKGISSRSSIVRAMSDNKLARALSTLGKSISGNKYIAGAAAASVLAALGLTASKFLGPYLMAGGYSKLGEPMLGSGSFMSPIFASPARQTSSMDSMMMSGSSPSNQFLTGYPASSLMSDVLPADTSSFNQQPPDSAPQFQRFLLSPGGLRGGSLNAQQLSNNNKPPTDSVTGYYSDFYNQNYPLGVPYSIDSSSAFSPPADQQTLQSQPTSFSIVTAEPSSIDNDQPSFQLDSTGALTPFTNASPPRRQTSAGSTSRRSGTVTLKLDKATRERLMRLKREQELGFTQFSQHQQPLIAFTPVAEPAGSSSYSIDVPATFVSFSPVVKQPVVHVEPLRPTSSPTSSPTNGDNEFDNDLPPIHKSMRLKSPAQQPVLSPSTMAQQESISHVFVRGPKKESVEPHIRSKPTSSQSLERPLVAGPMVNESTYGGSGGAWRLMLQDPAPTQPPVVLTSTPAPQKQFQPEQHHSEQKSADNSKPKACNPHPLQNQHHKSSSPRAHNSYTQC